MILALVGAIIVVIGINSESMSLGAIVIGAALILFGLALSNVFSESLKARGNRRRYWAYGDNPDWTRRK